MGARTGAATRGLVNIRNPHADYKEIISQAYSDPEFTVKLLKSINAMRSENPKEFRKALAAATAMNAKDKISKGIDYFLGENDEEQTKIPSGLK